MKRLSQVLTIVCVVVSQRHVKQGYLTECKGIEVNGLVVIASRVGVGQAVIYSPFIDQSDDFIHGRIESIGDPPPPVKKETIAPNDTGKPAL